LDQIVDGGRQGLWVQRLACLVETGDGAQHYLVGELCNGVVWFNILPDVGGAGRDALGQANLEVREARGGKPSAEPVYGWFADIGSSRQGGDAVTGGRAGVAQDGFSNFALGLVQGIEAGLDVFKQIVVTVRLVSGHGRILPASCAIVIRENLRIIPRFRQNWGSKNVINGRFFLEY